MKKNYISILFFFLLGALSTFAQTTLAQWNFNGDAATTVPGGATAPTPSVGTGTAALIGGVTASFASGVASGGSSDPVTTSPPNYGWGTTTYAASGTENKQRGVQFNVSTVGYAGITFMFDQRLSNSSNNTYVAQYTINGTDWVDAQTFTFTPAATGTGDTWYKNRTVDLSSIVALDNNANAAFRVVSAFEPTSGNYLSSTSTSTYATTGTVRFDMVTISAATTMNVDDFESSAFAMFPNPSQSMVHFNRVMNVSVFDLTGKKVLSKENVNSIDITELVSGIYFIQSEEGYTQKLIKE
ncbi:MAG: T9SS type A sorting domain-containing protein [Flavobacteriaceae bacterium]|nr:T9SS type A sorting domain-containing protein [Flavobacteriaceae bacterium]